MIVEISDLVKTYQDGDNVVEVLRGINLQIERGHFISIRGVSGAGKSTLLNILGALDSFDEGSVKINGLALEEQPRNSMHNFRKVNLGFVFQYHYLLPEFSILENVMMPLLILKEKKSIARERAAQTLEKVGLSHRMKHFPSQISGGESQRVAVARAIVHNPPLILADEPTGNLDGANTIKCIEILNELINDSKLTVIVVTHEAVLAKTAPRQFVMEAGRLSEITPEKNEHETQTSELDQLRQENRRLIAENDILKKATSA